jgi:DGQHR domain-containing protein
MGGVMKGKITIQCIEVTQPIGTFYIGSISSDDLLRISYADVRRVEDRDFERYLGIQRPLSKTRVKEIKQYVKNKDATFPTSVILAIESKNIINYDAKSGIMEIKNDENVVKIIDGQHRIAGLQDYKEDSPFFLNVTLFVDMDIENQAMVFGTINLAQTKVNKSLAYDLFDLTNTRSPQKTCHNIAVFLNNETNSPFNHRIKLLGVASEKNQTLTQAAIVEGILQYISGDYLSAMSDRDKLLRGEELPKVSDIQVKGYIFRNYFIENDDIAITEAVWNYFVAIKRKWPIAWKGVDVSGNILPRTNGFRALIRFLKPVFMSLNGLEQIPSIDEYQSIFEKISINDADFNRDKYLPGTSGESLLFTDLMKGFKTNTNAG